MEDETGIINTVKVIDTIILVLNTWVFPGIAMFMAVFGYISYMGAYYTTLTFGILSSAEFAILYRWARESEAAVKDILWIAHSNILITIMVAASEYIFFIQPTQDNLTPAIIAFTAYLLAAGTTYFAIKRAATREVFRTETPPEWE